MGVDNILSNLRTIPDFPKPGIMFRDISTVLKNPECLSELLDSMYEIYKDKGITKIVGVESRGFILGPALAVRLGAGFVMARKAGKLPADCYSQSYDLEYGKATIEIHKDGICQDDVVLIHDDLLATGGTVNAAIDLVKQFNPKQIFANFIIELVDLNGRTNLRDDVQVTSILPL